MDFGLCPCSGKTLARLVQPAVMAVLAAEPLHGYLIVQRLAKMRMFAIYRPDPTGVYRILKSMEQDGFVQSNWELADSGPAKRRFDLTASGRTCLAHWVKTLEAYQDAVADLMSVVTQANGRARNAAKPRSKRRR